MVVVAVGVALAAAGEKGEGGSAVVWGVRAVALEGEMGLSVKMGMPDMVSALEMGIGYIELIVDVGGSKNREHNATWFCSIRGTKEGLSTTVNASLSTEIQSENSKTIHGCYLLRCRFQSALSRCSPTKAQT